MADCGVGEMLFRVPVVVIVGATGAGKSKLAIDIAKKFGGEVISADSMQVYRGLDIITNKVTEEEAQGVPHHLLAFLEPSQRFSVVDFRDAALPIIDGLLSRQKLPVVVGGTHYYIESLLWKVLVGGGSPDEPTKRHRGEDSASDSDGDGDDAVTEAILKRSRGAADPEELRSVPSEELHRRLSLVDPEMAAILHPNNRRRIIRSLQVFRQLGRKHSEVLREQRAAAGGSSLGGPLRYPHSIILWPHCHQEVLDARLDARVDEMMRRGLVAELLDVHRRYNEQRLRDQLEPDYTEGIFQSIGFKEFHSWLVQPEEARCSEQGQAEMRRCADALKAATRRYARKQLRWIRNRFLRRPDRQVPPVYAVDTSDPDLWDEVVAAPAIAIVDSHLRGLPPPQQPVPLEAPLPNQEGTFHCPDCDRVFMGTFQWHIHMGSKKHARRAKKKRTLQPTTTQKADTPSEGLPGQEPSEPMPKEDPQEPVPKEDPQESMPKEDPQEPMPKEDPQEPMPKEDPQAPIPKEDDQEPVPKEVTPESMPKEESPEAMAIEVPTEAIPKDGPPGTMPKVLTTEQTMSKEDHPDEALQGQVPPDELMPKDNPPKEEDWQMKHPEDPPTSDSGGTQQPRGDGNEPATSTGDPKSVADLDSKHQVQPAKDGTPVSATINGTTSPRRE